MMSPTIVKTLMMANQYSASPYARDPPKLIATATTRQTVIQMAGLASDQKLIRTAAAFSSAGKTMTQLYCARGKSQRTIEGNEFVSLVRAGAHPVVPSHGETQSRSDEATSERDVAAGDREVCDHLAERDHDSVAQRADSGVTNEQTSGTTMAQRVGGT